MHSYIIPISQKFKQYSNEGKANEMKAYLRNQFEFFGLQTPLRRKLCKEHYKQYPISGIKELESIVKECFQLPQREYQYFAIELFAFHQQLWTPACVRLLEYCLVHKSWWDSVDHIASEWLGPFFISFPEKKIPVTTAWNQSGNYWLQRSSILFQKKYKQETDTKLLSKYILNVCLSKEFFIQKAIGWALREYSTTDPDWVMSFVQQHPLSPLSVREALKRIHASLIR